MARGWRCSLETSAQESWDFETETLLGIHCLGSNSVFRDKKKVDFLEIHGFNLSENHDMIEFNKAPFSLCSWSNVLS